MSSGWANVNLGAGISTVGSADHIAPAPLPVVQYQSQFDGGSEASSATVHRSPTYDIQRPHPMFGNNNAIFGGQFTQAENVHYNSIQYDGRDKAFEILQKHVSPAAFHNSAQRVDPPRCHPNTRVEILQTIYNWVLLYGYLRKTWILWLNGAAGAGKSAIMQSIIEQLLAVRSIISLGSFFFSRGDSTRNTMDPLIATLVYQLIQQIPETFDDILDTIAHNPLIFQQSIEFQLQHLIILPITHLPFYLRRLFAIFIDGLDECPDRNHQVNLLRVIRKVYNGDDIPIIFIIASRREIQIQSQFDSENISNLLETIPLDDSKASDDIRRYLNTKFTDIRKNHPFRRLLPSDWPSTSLVSEIVDKSSGQFIFASVVMNFVSSDRANPVDQLKIIHDLRLRNPSTEHPFAHLDALYQYIFSQVKHLDKVLDILAFRHIASFSSVKILEGIFLLESGTLEVLLVDLLPVLQFKPDNENDFQIEFLHASLYDFLQDPFRSQEYFIGFNKYHTKLLCMFLERPHPDPLLPNYNWENVALQEYWRLDAISRLLEKAKPSDQLQRAVMHFTRFHCIKIGHDNLNAHNRVQILRLINQLDFGDQGQAYQHVRDTLAEGHAKFCPSQTAKIRNKVGKSTDLCARIC